MGSGRRKECGNSAISFKSGRTAIHPKRRMENPFSFRICNNSLQTAHFCLLTGLQGDRYFKLCDKGNQAGLFLKTWFLPSEVAMGITYGCSKPG